jgi:acyl-CoA thioesterase
LVRVAITSDFAYSLPIMRRLRTDGGQFLMRQPFVSINADTTINLHRPPRGEWLCIDTHSHVDPIGAGTAGARLYDMQGVVGFVTQSLLVRGPESAPDSWKDYRGEIE